eukprot:732025_1
MTGTPLCETRPKPSSTLLWAGSLRGVLKSSVDSKSPSRVHELRFSNHVRVRSVSIVAAGETPHSKLLEFKGSSRPDTEIGGYELDVFAKNLSSPSSLFERLTLTPLVIGSDSPFLSRPILLSNPNVTTDHLVLRGRFQRLSLCIYGDVDHASSERAEKLRQREREDLENAEKAGMSKSDPERANLSEPNVSAMFDSEIPPKNHYSRLVSDRQREAKFSVLAPHFVPNLKMLSESSVTQLAFQPGQVDSYSILAPLGVVWEGEGDEQADTKHNLGDILDRVLSLDAPFDEDLDEIFQLIIDAPECQLRLQCHTDRLSRVFKKLLAELSLPNTDITRPLRCLTFFLSSRTCNMTFLVSDGMGILINLLSRQLCVPYKRSVLQTIHASAQHCESAAYLTETSMFNQLSGYQTLLWSLSKRERSVTSPIVKKILTYVNFFDNVQQFSDSVRRIPLGCDDHTWQNIGSLLRTISNSMRTDYTELSYTERCSRLNLSAREGLRSDVFLKQLPDLHEFAVQFLCSLGFVQSLCTILEHVGERRDVLNYVRNCLTLMALTPNGIALLSSDLNALQSLLNILQPSLPSSYPSCADIIPESTDPSVSFILHRLSFFHIHSSSSDSPPNVLDSDSLSSTELAAWVSNQLRVFSLARELTVLPHNSPQKLTAASLLYLVASNEVGAESVALALLNLCGLPVLHDMIFAGDTSSNGISDVEPADSSSSLHGDGDYVSDGDYAMANATSTEGACVESGGALLAEHSSSDPLNDYNYSSVVVPDSIDVSVDSDEFNLLPEESLGATHVAVALLVKLLQCPFVLPSATMRTESIQMPLQLVSALETLRDQDNQRFEVKLWLGESVDRLRPTFYLSEHGISGLCSYALELISQVHSPSKDSSDTSELDINEVQSHILTQLSSALSLLCSLGDSLCAVRQLLQCDFMAHLPKLIVDVSGFFDKKTTEYFRSNDRMASLTCSVLELSLMLAVNVLTSLKSAGVSHLSHLELLTSVNKVHVTLCTSPFFDGLYLSDWKSPIETEYCLSGLSIDRCRPSFLRLREALAACFARLLAPFPKEADVPGPLLSKSALADLLSDSFVSPVLWHGTNVLLGRILEYVASYDHSSVSLWSDALTSPSVRVILSRVLAFRSHSTWSVSVRVWVELVIQLSMFSMEAARLATGVVIDAIEAEFVDFQISRDSSDFVANGSLASIAHPDYALCRLLRLLSTRFLLYGAFRCVSVERALQRLLYRMLSDGRVGACTTLGVAVADVLRASWDILSLSTPPTIETFVDLCPSQSDLKALLLKAFRLVQESLSLEAQVPVALMTLRALLAAAKHPYGNAIIVSIGESAGEQVLRDVLSKLDGFVRTASISLLISQGIEATSYVVMLLRLMCCCFLTDDNGDLVLEMTTHRIESVQRCLNWTRDNGGRHPLLSLYDYYVKSDKSTSNITGIQLDDVIAGEFSALIQTLHSIQPSGDRTELPSNSLPDFPQQNSLEKSYELYRSMVPPPVNTGDENDSGITLAASETLTLYIPRDLYSVSEPPLLELLVKPIQSDELSRVVNGAVKTKMSRKSKIPKFRTRQYATGRAPSLHVDEFLARQRSNGRGRGRGSRGHNMRRSFQTDRNSMHPQTGHNFRGSQQNFGARFGRLPRPVDVRSRREAPRILRRPGGQHHPAVRPRSPVRRVHPTVYRANQRPVYVKGRAPQYGRNLDYKRQRRCHQT